MTGISVPSGMPWDAATPEALRETLHGRRVRTRLREELASMLTGDAVLGPCRIRRAKFKPGRKLTAHFDVRVRCDLGDVTRQVVVRWRPHGSDAVSSDRAHAPDAPGIAITQPFERFHGHLSDLNAEILVWPFDPALPRLHQLADPASVGMMLAPASNERSLAFEVDAIRYRPGERHVVRYVPRGSAAEDVGTVFAKLSRDADPARMGAIASRAADVLEASDPSTTAARPIRGIFDTGVLLLAGAGGRPLSKRFGRGLASSVRDVHRVGEALRALHAGSVVDGDGPPDGLLAHTQAACRASEHFAVLLPGVEMKVRDILARATEAYGAIGAEAPTLVHGDLKADHVLAEGRRLSFIDLGSQGTGDPAMDVGKFLADLGWWQPPRGPIGRQMRAAFLRGYEGEGDDPRVVRAGVWEAVLLLSIAAHRIPLWDAAWERRTRSLVDDAARVLGATTSSVSRSGGSCGC